MAEIIGQDDNKKVLKMAIELNLPVLCVGETGTGKTGIVRELSESQKKKCIRVNLNGQTSIDEFVGKWLVKNGETYWQDGVLIQAMKNGWWLLCDEVNACLPEILFVLHSLLDDDKSIVIAEKDGEIVKPNKNFRFFATMNPSEEYAGTKELNKAFVSRFPIILDFAWLGADMEAKLLHERTKIKEKQSHQLVGFGQYLRELKAREDLYYTCSTRDLIYWAEMFETLGLIESFRVCMLNRAQNGDRAVLNKAFEDYFGESIKLQEEYGVESISEVLEKIKQNLELEDEKIGKIRDLKEQLAKDQFNNDKDYLEKKAELEKLLQDIKDAKASISAKVKTNSLSRQSLTDYSNEFEKFEQSKQDKDNLEQTKQTKQPKTPDYDKPENEDCNHICDSCPTKDACLKDIKGVK